MELLFCRADMRRRIVASLQGKMNGERAQFCCFGTNLQNATILSVVFGCLRSLAIFLVWYQIRPDLYKTDGKSFYVKSMFYKIL